VASKAKPERSTDVSDEKWAEAVRREPTIRRLVANGQNSRVVMEAAGRDLGLSKAQLYRMVKAFRDNPVTQSLVVNKPGPQKGTSKLSVEVQRIIQQNIETVFKTGEKPTLKMLIREIWADCKLAGLPVPSRKAVSARISARSLKELVKAREGPKAARQRFAMVQPGLRPSVPLEIVQIDHTRVDIQLVDAPTGKKIRRPWLTMLLDVYSRCVLGFSLSYDAPSAADVGLAIRQGVLPKEEWLKERDINLLWPMHGIPQLLHLDNAREFRSKALERGCQQYGIAIQHRPPGAPRFGGHIERLMGTFMNWVHGLPGTFSNPQKRDDYPSEKRALLTLREFELIFALEVLGPYHNDIHTALGKTPASAWAEGIAASGNPRLPAHPGTFILDFLPFEWRLIRREGVRLFNRTYFEGALAPLLDRPDRKLRIKYDPQDISAVFVEMPDHSHVHVRYADLSKPPITLWEDRAVRRRLRKEGQESVNPDAIMFATTEKRRILAKAKRRGKAAAPSEVGSRSSADRFEASVPGQLALKPPPTTIGTASDLDDTSDNDAKVPEVVEDEAWKTEFLP
jgi:putative transposase